MAEIPAAEMPLPLRHPSHVIRQREADDYAFERTLIWYGFEPTLYMRLHRKLSGFVPSPARRTLSYLKAKLS
jgi:hypothetical protein